MKGGECDRFKRTNLFLSLRRGRKLISFMVVVVVVFLKNLSHKCISLYFYSQCFVLFFTSFFDCELSGGSGNGNGSGKLLFLRVWASSRESSRG